ncbi:hypothetical protein HK405_011444 [Cladochytrium tenue]|nr:hypothetical protein HK405_011444 [Cladochytrium tenue]
MKPAYSAVSQSDDSDAARPGGGAVGGPSAAPPPTPLPVPLPAPPVNAHGDRDAGCDLALAGVSVSVTPTARRWFLRIVVAYFVIAGLAVAAFVALGRGCGRKRNVILMISDGFGPASETMARNFNAYINNLTESAMLPLDTILGTESNS